MYNVITIIQNYIYNQFYYKYNERFK